MITRRAFFVFVSAVAAFTPTTAAQQPGVRGATRTLTAAEAKDHVGDTATVCGAVASTRYAAQSRGRPTFLNLDAPYPNQVFTVVIWGEARSAFPQPPETGYRGKRICVTGAADTYRGVPQIAARTPAEGSPGAGLAGLRHREQHR